VLAEAETTKQSCFLASAGSAIYCVRLGIKFPFFETLTTKQFLLGRKDWMGNLLALSKVAPPPAA